VVVVVLLELALMEIGCAQSVRMSTSQLGLFAIAARLQSQWTICRIEGKVVLQSQEFVAIGLV